MVFVAFILFYCSPILIFLLAFFVRSWNRVMFRRIAVFTVLYTPVQVLLNILLIYARSRYRDWMMLIAFPQLVALIGALVAAYMLVQLLASKQESS